MVLLDWTKLTWVKESVMLKKWSSCASVSDSPVTTSWRLEVVIFRCKFHFVLMGSNWFLKMAVCPCSSRFHFLISFSIAIPADAKFLHVQHTWLKLFPQLHRTWSNPDWCTETHLDLAIKGIPFSSSLKIDSGRILI